MTKWSLYGLMAVFAHPDDEGGMGGALAMYSEMGVRVQLVLATCGDGVDAKISDPALATRETLCEVRREEARCGCRILSIAEPVFLDYQDGEVDHLDIQQAAIDLARRLRAFRPQVVVTHGPEGGYGHPDHIAVSRFTTLAWELAADESYAPAKLYYTAVPRSIIQALPAWRERRADIRGRQLPFVGVADEEITTAVEVARYLERKQKALACHRTQFPVGPDGRVQNFYSTVPEEARQRYFQHERFVLARSRVARPTSMEADLFAGLEEEYTGIR